MPKRHGLALFALLALSPLALPAQDTTSNSAVAPNPDPAVAPTAPALDPAATTASTPAATPAATPAPAAPTAAETALAAAEAALAEAKAAAEASAQEARDLEARVAELEAGAAELENRLLEAEAAGEEARGQVIDIERRLAELETERDALLSRLEGARLGMLDATGFEALVAQGFGEAAPRIGSWKISGGRAYQTDAKQFFARLEMPLEQDRRPYLYRFSASSTGTGWVGLGFHLFASGVKSRRGYGEGRSLLVWLTRDPAVRKTDATYLQLYRSDDDVAMERVLDAKLEERIENENYVEILYDPDAGYISVSLNGRLAARYRTWFGIEGGVGVSFRTLGGGASFGDFEILAAE